MTTPTLHSIIRAKQRFGLSESQAKKVINNAFYRGKTAKEYSFEQKDYLSNIEQRGCVPIVYNNYCWIFSKDYSTCITVYALPHWFNEKAFFHNKERIRNPKKYFCRYIQQ